MSSVVAKKPRATGASETGAKDGIRRFTVEGHGCPRAIIEAFDPVMAGHEYRRVFDIAPIKLVTNPDGEVVSVPRSITELQISEVE